MAKIKYVLVFAAIGILAAAVMLLYPELVMKPGENEDGIKYLIGVSQPELTSPWRLAMNEQIRREAGKYPEMKVIFYDAGEDDIKQKQDIENMLEQKIDLLIVSPNNSRYLEDVIGGVHRSGIPVIVMETPPETEDYTMYIFCDNYKIGKSAGEYVCKMLGDKGGTVLEVLGDPDSFISIERKRGFREALKENPAVRPEYVVVGHWSRDKTEERVAEIYKKHPAVDVVFAHNDAMAIGTWRVAAYEKLNIRAIGVGGLGDKNAGLEAVNNGVLEATFIYPTGGREAVDWAFRILSGESAPRKLELPAVKVTKENVRQFIK